MQVHDAEQREPGIKPTMKRLLFHYQGHAAHSWRSREDLWQEMCLGNLHGLVCRRGKESLTPDKEKGHMHEYSEVVQKSKD